MENIKLNSQNKFDDDWFSKLSEEEKEAFIKNVDEMLEEKGRRDRFLKKYGGDVVYSEFLLVINDVEPD